MKAAIPRAPALLLAGIFVIKLAIVWQLKDHPLLQPDAGLDTTAYVSLAQRVLAGHVSLGPGLYYVAPFYIYFLAGTLALFDSFTAVRVVQVLLGTVAVGAVFFMALTWFGRRAGWIAAILAGATGLFTFYEVLILQSSLDVFFTASGLALLTWHLHRSTGGERSALAGLLCGAVFGLGTLNRPNLLVGALAIVAAAAIMRRWRTAALVCLGLLAGTAPVLLRNMVVSGEPALVSSHGGLNLYIGNHAGASGFYQEIPGIRPLIEGQQEDTRRVASRALGREVSDAEASEYFRQLAFSWMIANPREALVLFVRKLFFTLHAQHVALPHSYPFYANDMATALRFLPLGPWLIMPLGLVGVAMAWRTEAAAVRTEFFVWAAFIPGYAAGVALFFVAERYRLALLVPLCVTAAGAVDIAWQRWRTRRGRTLAVPVAGFAAIALALNWPMPFLNDGRWDEGLRLAQRLVITGDADAADRWVERLERTASKPGRAHHGVGMQFVVQDRPERALPHLRRALELGFLSADDPEVWLRLGRLAARTEGAPAAEPFFRRAVALAPGQASARQQYGLNLLVLGQIDGAERELREAVRLDGSNADSLAHLAYCEIKRGQLEPGRQHVRAALAIDSGHQLARQLAAAIGL